MFFVVDPDKEVAPQQSAFVWQRLWEMRDLTPVGALLPAVVTSACPLLPDESADATLVASLTHVPAGSAWVSLELDLLQFARRDGVLREARLEAALWECVAQGERRHDETRWPDRSQVVDSNNNRRLSVFVRGWGDLVSLRGADPGSLDTLRDLSVLAERVAALLAGASKSMAAKLGYCPVLDIAGARIAHYGREMNQRWRRAVMDNALRHRNLLTLSPWDVFPRGGPADFRFMNLLPIVCKAHSVSMRRDVDISGWQAKDFQAFHKRVSAMLRNAGDPPVAVRQV